MQSVVASMQRGKQPAATVPTVNVAPPAVGAQQGAAAAGVNFTPSNGRQAAGAAIASAPAPTTTEYVEDSEGTLKVPRAGAHEAFKEILHSRTTCLPAVRATALCASCFWPGQCKVQQHISRYEILSAQTARQRIPVNALQHPSDPLWPPLCALWHAHRRPTRLRRYACADLHASSVLVVLILAGQ